MTEIALLFAPVFTALFGLLLSAIIALRPPGLPLSVRVPQAHADDAIVLTAIRRFRWGLVLAWVITAALGLTLALVGQTPLAVVLPVLLYTALGILDLILNRRTITRAKREGNWFEGIPVRVSAQLTPPEYRNPPIIWPALAAIALAAATAVDVALYPSLPDPIAVHFNAAGDADRWAPKSVWSVFGILIIGAAVVVLLTVISMFAARYAARTQTDDTAQQATLRTQVQRTMLTSLLSELSFVIALGISATELAQRLLPNAPWTVAASAIGMVVLIMTVIIWTVARAQVQLRPANVRDPRGARPDAVDDDQHWKGGLFYVNRDDPTLVVPRRFGLGWTINFGRPAGIVLTVLLLLIIAAGVTAVILTSHAG